MKAPTPIDMEDRLLAAEYALGTLPHGERRAFARRLEGETALQMEADIWDSHFSALALEYESMEAPGHLKQAIDARLFAETSMQSAHQAGAVTGDESFMARLWNSLALWRGTAMIGIAAALLLAINISRVDDQLTSPTTSDLLVAQIENDDRSLQVLTVFDPELKQLRVSRVAGSVASGRDHELWLIDEAGTPVSVGLLPREAANVLAINADLAPRFDDEITLAISDEPAGGSPTGAPTGPVLAAATPRSI